MKHYIYAAIGLALLVLAIIYREWLWFSLWASGALPTQLSKGIVILGGSYAIWVASRAATRRNIEYYADEHRRSLVEEVTLLKEQLAEERKRTRAAQRLADDRAVMLKQVSEITGRVE